MLKNISVSKQILFLSFIGIVFLGLVSVITLVTLDDIGKKLINIAEKDIPLTQMISDTTVHQLEQSIYFERAMRFGQSVQQAKSSEYQAAKSSFFNYSKLVDKEIKQAKNMADDVLKDATDAAMIEEFTHVRELLDQIEKEHKDFETHSVEAFDLLEKGKNSAADRMAKVIIKEEKELNKHLEDLLHEISEFTAQAALDAEHYEKRAIKLSIIVILMSIISSVVLSFLLRRIIVSSIKAAASDLNDIASGNTQIEVSGKCHTNEFGTMALAIEKFRTDVIENERLRQIEEEKTQKEHQRSEHIAQLVGNFKDNMSQAVSGVAAASTQLNQTASSMNNLLGQAKESVVSVASATEETSANVQTVASAAEELSASVAEISGQLTKTTGVVSDSVQKATSADQTTLELNSAAERIGNVVDLIQDIAEQINLLALNATIESARAGEAGKGFAVVASEVKNLASQASNAVEEINNEVEEVQKVAAHVVDVIKSIKDGINNVNEYAESVASAVEEQSATTKEIASSMTTASTGVSVISKDITGVTNATEEAKAASAEVLGASGELSQQAESLNRDVKEFIDAIQSA